MTLAANDANLAISHTTISGRTWFKADKRRRGFKE